MVINALLLFVKGSDRCVAIHFPRGRFVLWYIILLAVPQHSVPLIAYTYLLKTFTISPVSWNRSNNGNGSVSIVSNRYLRKLHSCWNKTIEVVGAQKEGQKFVFVFHQQIGLVTRRRVIYTFLVFKRSVISGTERCACIPCDLWLRGVRFLWKEYLIFKLIAFVYSVSEKMIRLFVRLDASLAKVLWNKIILSLSWYGNQTSILK